MSQTTPQSTNFSQPNGNNDPPIVVVPPTSDRSESDTAQVDTEKDEILNSKIMIIDDEQLVIRVVRRFLASEGYTDFTTITDSRVAVDKIIEFNPDLILLDIMMPHVTGLDVLKSRLADPRLRHIPVIILSASSENNIKLEALKLGATEFLSKPVNPIDLVLRVKNALIVKRHHDYLQNYAVQLEEQVRNRTKQIERSRELIVHCLAKAAEFRDHETGEHVVRVGKCVSIIAKELGFGPNYCHQIGLAAQLHDVGKIGIPDAILLNPGKLTNDEFEIMKLHCNFGCQIMEPLIEDGYAQQNLNHEAEEQTPYSEDSSLLVLAGNIARTHHEKWDGTGYPNGLKGAEIPIEGRITCVADVFDALCSERPYKQTFPLEKCLKIMMSERGIRFDPDVLDAFFRKIEAVIEIRKLHIDLPPER